MGVIKPIRERLLHFSKPRPNGCREWTGEFNVCGYGRLSVQRNGKRKQPLAHRLSYEMFVAPIPPGMMVLHRCDNPKCVAPDHLWLGTNADNMADKVRKGRQARLARDNNGNAKLNNAALRVIAESKLPDDILAIAFGVCVETIYFARRETRKLEERNA